MVVGWWLVGSGSSLVVRGWGLRAALVAILVTPVPVRGQAPPAAPTPAAKPDTVLRVSELIAKSSGTYKEIALGVWETTYKGKNLPVIRVRIAAAQDGVFFIVPLFTREKLALSQAFLLRIAEFNAQYDFVKLALDKASLNLRLDVYAPLVDAAAFTTLEGQAALAADEAYGLIRNLLPVPAQ